MHVLGWKKVKSQILNSKTTKGERKSWERREQIKKIEFGEIENNQQ